MIIPARLRLSGLTLALTAALLACGNEPTQPVPAATDGPAATDAGPMARSGAQALSLTVLHELDIQVEPQDLERLENDREQRVPCTLRYDGVTLAQVGIRQKGGNGSISDLAGKPGFSIKFDEFVKGQKLDGLKKLLVNNAVQDESLLNEPIGYELYRRAGIPAPRTAHTVVTLNGFTYGIYVLAEAVDGDFLEHAFGKGNHKGNLYEGSSTDFVSDPDGIELKDEAEDMRERADLRALAQAVEQTSDDQLAAVLGQRLDLDGFITGFAIDALANHWDGYAFGTNNYYLYHHPVSDRFVYLPHGMDQLFQDPEFDVNSQPAGILAARLRLVPALDQRYAEARRRVLAEAWDVAALHALIDQVSQVLHSTTRTDERVVQDLQRFDEHVEPTRQVVADRKASLAAGR